MRKARQSEPLGLGQSQGSSDSEAIISHPHKERGRCGRSWEEAAFELHSEAGFWSLLLASQEEQGRRRKSLLLLSYFCIQGSGMWDVERNPNYDEFHKNVEKGQSNVERGLEKFPSLTSFIIFLSLLSFLCGQEGLALFGTLQRLAPRFAWSRYPLKWSLIAQVLNDNGPTSAFS